MSNNKTWDKLVELTKNNNYKPFEVTFEEWLDILMLNWKPGNTQLDSETYEKLHNKLGNTVKIVPLMEFDPPICDWLFLKFDFIGENGKEVYLNPKLLEN